MNVFEDLVVELKEENLLEETVIDRSGQKASGNGRQSSKTAPNERSSFEVPADFSFDVPSFEVSNVENSTSSFQSKPNPETVKHRLSERMASLQFVEYVLTAIEANFTGASNTPFDDLSTKKALHTFEQATSDFESDEYFEAESALLSRLENWEEALAERDRLIPVDLLRRYTETASPPLSPQTLFALVRFYRGVESSETTRSKFDFVSTRLFSKFVDGEHRDLLCHRSEIVRHLNQRFTDWSGGQYRRTDADDPNTALFVLSFDDFIAEANSASDLSEMIDSNLFERVREFKDGTGEMFMIPEVSAAAIECNVLLANKVIDLISLEIQAKSAAAVRSRYANANIIALSDAVARTMNITPTHNSDVSDDEPDYEPATVKPTPKPKERPATRPQSSKSTDKTGSKLLGVNRWLLLATVLAVVLSLGIYSWAEYFSGADESEASNVKTIDLDKPELKQYIKLSRLSGNMLYVIVTPEYEKLNDAAQRDYLQKMLKAGSANGYSKVSMVDIKGKDMGYASAERIETANK